MIGRDRAEGASIGYGWKYRHMISLNTGLMIARKSYFPQEASCTPPTLSLYKKEKQKEKQKRENKNATNHI